MTRPRAREISLGERRWLIRPLTLAQVRDIEPIMFAQTIGGGTVAAALEVIAVALARDHAAAVESLPGLEATASDVASALATILELGGFTRGDAPSGEAEAGLTAPA